MKSKVAKSSPTSSEVHVPSTGWGKCKFDPPLSGAEMDIFKALSFEDDAEDASGADSIPVDSRYDVPYLAGLSRDRSVIYIQRGLPKFIEVNGKRLNFWAAIEIHELVEKALMDNLGWSYEKAHELATADEQHFVEEHGVDWQAYTDALAEPIKNAREGFKELPPDLDLTTYKSEGDNQLVADMIKLQPSLEGDGEAVEKEDGDTRLVAGSETANLLMYQELVSGIDYEASVNRVADPVTAKEIAVDNLTSDPDFYHKKWDMLDVAKSSEGNGEAGWDEQGKAGKPGPGEGRWDEQGVGARPGPGSSDMGSSVSALEWSIIRAGFGEDIGKGGPGSGRRPGGGSGGKVKPESKAPPKAEAAKPTGGKHDGKSDGHKSEAKGHAKAEGGAKGDAKGEAHAGHAAGHGAHGHDSGHASGHSHGGHGGHGGGGAHTGGIGGATGGESVEGAGGEGGEAHGGETEKAAPEKTVPQSGGLKLDLGSGAAREPGHLGVDLYQHDIGTIVHDLTLGLPFDDQSATHVRMVNALHEMDETDQKPLLSEIARVMQPGGQFVYEGPNELQNFPEQLEETERVVGSVAKVEGQAGWVKQKFKRVATPDAATANDAEPRTGVAQYDMLPADALLAMDAMGYYWSDATSSGRGNRAAGYPSQGAMVQKKVRIAKIDKARQIIYCVVLSPEESDLQNDFMLADDIEKAAHGYLAQSRVIGSNHERAIDATPVESYIAPIDFEMDGGAKWGKQQVKKGSWIIGIKIFDPDEWSQVENGEYEGVSVGGFGLRDEI